MNSPEHIEPGLITKTTRVLIGRPLLGLIVGHTKRHEDDWRISTSPDDMFIPGPPSEGLISEDIGSLVWWQSNGAREEDKPTSNFMWYRSEDVTRSVGSGPAEQ